jgi:hypothetical protein
MFHVYIVMDLEHVGMSYLIYCNSHMIDCYIFIGTD